MSVYRAATQLLDSGDVQEIRARTGLPLEICELAVREWADVSAKIGNEPVIDRLSDGGIKVRDPDGMRHLQSVLRKLTS